jgi:hypothetical protein
MAGKGKPVSEMETTQRRLDIDHLRNLAVLLLLVFHTARLFDAEPWHVKDASTYLAADLVVRAMNQWHMPLLFLLAGMSLFFALARRSLAATLRERLARLLVPLAAGMILIVPPQVYVERITPHPLRQSPIDFAGSYLDFQRAILDCCYPQGNLGWHHLWFVAYLLTYSLALAPLLAGLQRRGFASRAAAWFGHGWRPLLLALPLIAAEMLLRRRFPTTHALVGDWANHAHYAGLLVIGWAIAASPLLEDNLLRRRHRHAAIGVALAGIWTLLALLPPLALEFRLVIRVAGEWACLLAFLGYARHHLDRPLGWLTRFTRLAMPFYILHQTAIVLLGWMLRDWSGDPLAKFATVMIGAGLVSLAGCHLIDSNPLTRLLVGLKPERASARPSPAERAVAGDAYR